MHREVATRLDEARTSGIENHNYNTHVMSYNPSLGDFVVVERMHGSRTMMSASWVGPRRITKIQSDFTVEVEHLMTHEKKSFTFHECTRISALLSRTRLRRKMLLSLLTAFRTPLMQ